MDNKALSMDNKALLRKTSLEEYIRSALKKKDILIMTHIVIGYPTLEESYEIVRIMVEAGVDLMELQIPFSEPVADGPVILNANQLSLSKGITVQNCLDFAEKAASEFNIPFLFMSYYNILYKFGVERFAGIIDGYGLKGAIVPDLPFEEGGEYIGAMKKHGLSPVFLYSPTTPDERMKNISNLADGFIYCVARRGITGMQTSFSIGLDKYLERCRKSTNLPLALGFGVKGKSDIDFLKGKVEIAIIGTQSIKAMDEGGIPGVDTFIRSLAV